MNYWFLGAGSINLLWAFIHLFLGGRDIARPLLNSPNLEASVKYVLYVCWHVTTLVLVAISIMFLVAAYMSSQALVLSMIATLLTIAIVIMGLVIPPVLGQSYKIVPQGWLFVPVAILGLFGIFY